MRALMASALKTIAPLLASSPPTWTDSVPAASCVHFQRAPPTPYPTTSATRSSRSAPTVRT